MTMENINNQRITSLSERVNVNILAQRSNKLLRKQQRYFDEVEVTLEEDEMPNNSQYTYISDFGHRGPSRAATLDELLSRAPSKTIPALAFHAETSESTVRSHISNLRKKGYVVLKHGSCYQAIKPTEVRSLVTDQTYDQLLKSQIDPNFTFGMEFEFMSKLSGREINQALKRLGLTARVEGDASRYSNHGNNIDYSNWNVTYDMSIHLKRGYTHKIELVTPILKGIEGLNQLQKVTNWLNGQEKLNMLKANSSCGTHVHHGNFSPITGRRTNTSIVENLIKLYADHQTVFDTVVAKTRRSSNPRRSRYCPPCNRTSFFNRAGSFNISTYGERGNVNLNNYISRGTVEFRQHQGTLSFKKIVSWVILGQKILRKAKSLSTVDREPTVHSTLTPFMKEIKVHSDIIAFFEKRQRTLKGLDARRSN